MYEISKRASSGSEEGSWEPSFSAHVRSPSETGGSFSPHKVKGVLVLVGFCAVLELESWWVLWDAVIQQEKLQAVEVLKGFSQSAFVLQALQVGFILLPQLKLKASIN